MNVRICNHCWHVGDVKTVELWWGKKLVRVGELCKSCIGALAGMTESLNLVPLTNADMPKPEKALQR